ncbi:hypothetical protein ACS0TY_000641 [Phlomoides rotata]
MMIIDRYKISQDAEDTWNWKLAPNGLYSTKHAYNNMLKEMTTPEGEETRRKAFKKLWKAWAPKKFSIIAWKAFRERLATVDNLRVRGMEFSEEEALCPLCRAAPETNRHILFDCTTTTTLWSMIYSLCQVSPSPNSVPHSNFLQFCGLMGRKNNARVAATIWIGTVWKIWHARNNLVFNNMVPNVRKIVDEIKVSSRSWLSIKMLSVKEASCADWLGDCRKFLGD